LPFVGYKEGVISGAESHRWFFEDGTVLGENL